MTGRETFIDDDPPRWVAASNDFMEDPRLSWKAKGMLVYLKGRPPGWQPQVHHLSSVSTDGRTAVETGLNELIELGFMRRDLLREGNRITGTGYRFSWWPRWEDDLTRFGPRSSKSRPAPAQDPGPVVPDPEEPGNQVPGNQGSEDPRRISTDPTTTELTTPDLAIPLVAASDAESCEEQPGDPDVVADDPQPPKVNPLTDPDPRWADAREVAEALAARWSDRYGEGTRLVVSKQGVKDADLLLRLGGLGAAAEVVPLDRALRLIGYLFDHMTDTNGGGFCWAKVIQSPGNLREHWLKLRADANQHRANGNRPTPARHVPGGSDEANDAAAEAAKARARARAAAGPVVNPMIGPLAPEQLALTQ